MPKTNFLILFFNFLMLYTTCNLSYTHLSLWLPFDKNKKTYLSLMHKEGFVSAMSNDHLMKAKEKTSKQNAQANQQIHLKVFGIKMLVITKNPFATKRDPIMSKK